MSTQKSRKDFVSHSVLNDRYPHGRVEKITADGIWLEGGTRWWHFDKARLKNQVLPRVGAYVVMTESAPGIIGHIATQHETQQPSDADIALIGSTMEAMQPEPKHPSEAATEQPNTATEQSEQPNTATKQLNTALLEVAGIDSLVDYRIRTDALALAVQLLNLEAHYGIDRDDIFRVAQEVIRWIQKRGEG